ncbi:MAG: DUF374 domain-containing protein [Alphaproteobacteria bacterium]|nr:DUF374 domain-containing protein [Alphaproteobacteria bacterium]
MTAKKKKSLAKRIKHAVWRSIYVQLPVAFLVSVLVRVIQRLSPTKYIGDEKLIKHIDEGRPAVFVLWHSRALFMNKLWREKLIKKKPKLYSIFSSHHDGRLLSLVYRCLGMYRILSNINNPASTKKTALTALKILKRGDCLGITPDGPRGPNMTFSTDSAFLFAKASGAPIIPLYISADRAKFLRTWDRFMIILPFSKSKYIVDDFIYVDRNATAADIRKLKEDLTARMREKTAILDHEMLGDNAPK